jgi:chitodextrinase
MKDTTSKVRTRDFALFVPILLVGCAAPPSAKDGGGSMPMDTGTLPADSGSSMPDTGSAGADAGHVPSPTAMISAHPASIIAGQSSVLTWSSIDATQCTGMGFTASGTSGSSSVSPTVTTSYSIACSGEGGTSPAAMATVTVAADTTPPSVPSGVTASAISSSQINLTWAPSTDDVGVAGYRIFRDGTQIGTSASSAYSDSGLASSTTYSFAVSAYDAAGNNSQRSSIVMATTPTSTSGANSYSTNFPRAENPISEGGRFITSTTPGVNWSGLKLGGCGCKPVAPVAVSAPGLADSPLVGDASQGDALALLTGVWGPDQSASMVVANIPPANDGSYQEVEIHLRSDLATGRGYEITWAYNHDYILIVTWNGGGAVGQGAAYTVLVQLSGSQYAIAPNDTLMASIVGNVITMYRNGTQIYQYTDTQHSFTSGNPGFGFNEGAASNYGISSFSASSR